MSEVESADFPQQYTHSVKVSDTAKGIRIDVHVWATDQKTAIEEAIGTYLHAREVAMEEQIPLAPIEVKSRAKEELDSIAYHQQRDEL